MTQLHSAGRRHFIKSTSAVAGVTLASAPVSVFAQIKPAQADSLKQIGFLIGAKIAGQLHGNSPSIEFVDASNPNADGLREGIVLGIEETIGHQISWQEQDGFLSGLVLSATIRAGTQEWCIEVDSTLLSIADYLNVRTASAYSAHLSPLDQVATHYSQSFELERLA